MGPDVKSFGESKGTEWGKKKRSPESTGRGKITCWLSRPVKKGQRGKQNRANGGKGNPVVGEIAVQ